MPTANDALKVRVSPHIHSGMSVKRVMWETLFALVPAVICGIYYFGLSAMRVMAVSVLFAVSSEYLFRRLRRRETDLLDGSAVLTGMLFALSVPPALPLWAAAVGVTFGIIFGKQIFGGLGQNIFNPALLGRVFLSASFPVLMTSFVNPVDGVTGATPLGVWKFTGEVYPHMRLLLGNIGGCIGETGKIWLLLGGVFLLLRRHISWHIPVTFLATFLAGCGIFHLTDSARYPDPLWHLLAGGLILGVFFMATDPVTTPVTKKGRLIFGAGCGITLLVIRLFAGLPEGVMHSILIMNGFAPLINRITRQKRYGLK
ncbi:MAG TPA: RnfABCDGE type electron transport complex subunit D [bacterium]|nr:RnfABCDGE type electron transport complex subunit D [bacterium]